MTACQAAAFIIGQVAALLIGYLVRPYIDRLRFERRFRRELQGRESAREFEARARQALRNAMDAVPMTRSRQ